MYVLLLPIKEKYHLNLSVSILIDPPFCIITCWNAVLVIKGLKVSLVSPNRNLALQLSLIAAVCIAFLSTPQTNYSVAITDAVTLDLNGNTWGSLKAAGNVTEDIAGKELQQEREKNIYSQSLFSFAFTHWPQLSLQIKNQPVPLFL